MSNSFQGNRDRDQQDKVTGHVYDGIEEFDNKLPNWWLWLLWGSIAFALGYWLVFQTLQLRDTPIARFQAEMLQAQEAELARMEAAGISDDSLLLMSGMSNKVAEGRELFVKHCVSCHKDQGQGDIGPNLTDGFWIHGCNPMSLHGTVAIGVPAKGMPAWQNQLGPSRVQTVVSYVLTLRNTNVPGKAPEGQPCEY